jgi:hypothetical protein
MECISFFLCFLGGVLILAYFLGREQQRKKQQQRSAAKLERWRDAESRDVKRPRDPRTKYCFANIGKEITINYNGARRTIIPIRVFTKPQFHKTYVLAKEDGEYRHFDIDDVSLVATMQK